MKKTNITKFAKTALQVSKMTKRPIAYYSKDGNHTICCDYFFLSTDSEDLYKAILSKIPENKQVPDSRAHDGIRSILSEKSNLKQMTDSGIVAEGQYGFRRFLICDDFVTTINDDYLYIFNGERKMIMCRGINQPVLVFSPGAEYTAGILPLRHRSNEAALATMHRLIGRSGWQPDREED